MDSLEEMMKIESEECYGSVVKKEQQETEGEKSIIAIVAAIRAVLISVFQRWENEQFEPEYQLVVSQNNGLQRTQAAHFTSQTIRVISREDIGWKGGK